MSERLGLRQNEVCKVRKKKNKNILLELISKGLVLLFAIVMIFYSSEKIQNTMYPVKYEETILKYSAEYNLDPFLILAVIKVESAFNETAVSNKDARGLMQIMPTTAQWISKKLGQEEFNEADLFEPEKNIMLGTWYINYLIEKFNGNTELAIMAYNAGPTSVQNWLKEGTIYEENIVVSSIPYDETANYAKKIKDAYEMYKKIYD